MIIDKEESMSDEIDALLRDIYEYLQKKKENASLSADDRKIAEELIERSKKQLQKISIIKSVQEKKVPDVNSKSVPLKTKIPLPQNECESYVDMNVKSTNDFPPPLPAKTMEPTKPRSLPICPFQDLPAKDVSREIKHGTLSLRRKVFNIISHSSKIFGGIHKNWLLLYRSHKDAKPFCVLDLKQYEAKEDEPDANLTELDINKDGGLRKNSFKVFLSKEPDKNLYTLVATTRKDMKQWVEYINSSHDKAVRISKGIDNQVYEICQQPLEDTEEENIYSEIDIKSFKPPILAPKVSEVQKLPSESLVEPTVPSGPSPTESIEELYQELTQTDKQASMTSLNSFSAEEEEEYGEDETYYDLATLQNEVKKLDQKNNIDVNIVPPPDSLSTDENLIYENDAIITPPPLVLEQVELPTDDKNKVEHVEETLNLQKKPIIKPFASKPTIINKLSHMKKISNSKIKSEDIFQPNAKSSNDITCTGNSKKEDISTKPNEASSIVKIIRTKFSNFESQSRNLETFSRNSKTFQASPPVNEDSQIDFRGSVTREIDNTLNRIDSLKPASSQNAGDNEKPMVLLKPDMDDANTSKKLKKSPVIHSKPNKVAKKLKF